MLPPSGFSAKLVEVIVDQGQATLFFDNGVTARMLASVWDRVRNGGDRGSVRQLESWAGEYAAVLKLGYIP